MRLGQGGLPAEPFHLSQGRTTRQWYFLLAAEEGEGQISGTNGRFLLVHFFYLN